MVVERITFNQSRIKTFNNCPKSYEYKYIELIEPKRKARPLFLGSWIHSALESVYKDESWKVGHQPYVDEWNKLFEEERAEMMEKYKVPLPEVVERIIKSYLWYYRNDGWKPVMVEKILEVETPLVIDGKKVIFKGRLDLVIEDEEGKYWLVDHKTASTIPQPTAFHAMDPQLMLYPWAAKIQYGIDLAGIQYNYLRSRPASIPKLTARGAISRRKIVTDYPTLFRFLKSNGYNPNDFADILRPLAKRSPLLRRYRLPREEHVTREVLRDVLSVVKRIQSTKRFTRTITRDCVRCPYVDICRSELNGFDTTLMRKKFFQTVQEDYVVGNSNPDELEEDSDEDEEG